MNWLDFLLIGILGLGALLGMRVGVFGAGVQAIAAYVGWQLAGRIGSELGRVFPSSASETIVTVTSYVAIIVLVLLVARLLYRMARPLLTVFTLGLSSMVDRLGGLVMGIVLGLILSIAIMVGLARLTYNFDTDGLSDQLAIQATKVGAPLAGRELADISDEIEDVKLVLEDALTSSLLGPFFFNVIPALPVNALGVIPQYLLVAFYLLKTELGRAGN